MPATATPLSATVKTRIPQDWRFQLEKAAKAENLDISDIVRRALSQYIARRKRTKAAKSHGAAE